MKPQFSHVKKKTAKIIDFKTQRTPPGCSIVRTKIMSQSKILKATDRLPIRQPLWKGNLLLNSIKHMKILNILIDSWEFANRHKTIKS